MSAAPQLLDALLKAIAQEDGLWVPLEAYLAEYRESREAVYTRRSKGIWKDGVHCKNIKGAGLWINLTEVNRWAAGAKCESRKGSRSDTAAPESPRASASPSSTEGSSAANDS